MTETPCKQKGQNGIPQGYIGVRELCEMLGKTRKTIYQMIAEGWLKKPLKDGKLNIWDRKEIKRWLDNAKFVKRTTEFPSDDGGSPARQTLPDRAGREPKQRRRNKMTELEKLKSHKEMCCSIAGILILTTLGSIVPMIWELWSWKVPASLAILAGSAHCRSAIL
jgi:predicted DNA-binding transcriptional regulator AlpA